jgi:hypothetical protein
MFATIDLTLSFAFFVFVVCSRFCQLLCRKSGPVDRLFKCFELLQRSISESGVHPARKKNLKMIFIRV